MIVKDIVNRDIANLTNCESEPIHIPGSIQEHGFLLGLGKENFVINYCSANAHHFLHTEENRLLGNNFSALVSEQTMQEFLDYIASFNIETSLPFVFVFQEVQYNTTIHYTNDTYFWNASRFPDGSMSLPTLYLQTKKFVGFMEDATRLQPLCQKIAEETRQITGYDRVMIYRFDKEYNGEVFAESKIEGIESFLGHHYPHTDIPVQARELYMRNLMRMIADVNYTPVPLLTIDNDATNKSLDLSMSVLRSVSPIHIQYLKNMGVGATLTISLINDKKLWGLISCHHYSAKNLPHYKRLAAQLQGHFLTSQINVREVAEEYEVNLRVDAQLKTLLGTLYQNEDFFEQLCASSNLTMLADATGVVIVNDNRLYTCGDVPKEKDIWALVLWLTETQKETYDTDHLAADYAYAASISDTASGIVYYNLGKSGCIIWMRPEWEKIINWAGDPDAAVIKDNSLAGLSPRKSFALWQQVVKYKSRSWCKGEVSGAIQFATALQKQLHLLDSRNEEERYRKVNLRLKAVNNELENINWISTHDLKEPLRKIQIFASKLLDSDDNTLSVAVSNTIVRMSTAAKKMQNLIEDILTYSHLSNSETAFEPTNLSHLLQEIKTELEEEIMEKKAILIVGELPVVNGIHFQLKQLFINLVNNALKFTKDGVPPVIKITCQKMTGKQTGIADALGAREYYKIAIADNGIGFNNEYLDKIFSVFQRLHTNKQYTGTGIGLAICKKIMETHDGFIDANGEVREGATFNLYFPKME